MCNISRQKDSCKPLLHPHVLPQYCRIKWGRPKSQKISAQRPVNMRVSFSLACLSIERCISMFRDLCPWQGF